MEETSRHDLRLINMKLTNVQIDLFAILISLFLIITGVIIEPFATKEALMIVFGLAFVIGGYAKAKEGILDTIKNKQLNVEILMILAAIGAFIVNDFKEGAILILIFGFSGVLEEYATSKSEKAFKNLLKLAPTTALKVVGEELLEVEAKELQIGDVVVVKNGDSVPSDGKIVKGSTSLNEQAITGEFLPVEKAEGNPVYAGTINLSSTIHVEVTKNPSDTIVQKIIDFVKEAQEQKTESQTWIDRVEKYYVYLVILFSIMMMTLPIIFNWLPKEEAIYRGIVILVVGSPCALVASVSPAVLSSLSNAARKGILIKGGSHLERLRSIDTIVFDKTGTLTEGKPKVIGYHVLDISEDLFKSIVYSMESQSNHPLALSIVNYFSQATKVELETKESAGFGVEAVYEGQTYFIGRKNDNEITTDNMKAFFNQGATLVYVYQSDQLVGYIGLKDTLRKDAIDVIKFLKNNQIETMMLTGDNEFTAKAIAEELKLDSYKSNCFPDSKRTIIEELNKDNKHVMMVGDGINDAPALSLASVGVAMGDGTDVSLETADVVFMNNKLSHILSSITLSKRMKNVILQNMIFSISVIVLLLISNLFGWVLLPIGVIFHEGSTILVILNSLRLLFK